MIVIDRVSLKVTAGTAVNGVSIEISPKEFICIIGSSGSGKTLLVEMLAGAKKPSSGKITVDGVDIHDLPPALMRLYRREIGYVRQGDNQLLPERSIAANVALALGTGRLDWEKTALRTTELLDRIGLLENAADLPEMLNRGKRKLVSLAQALARGPEILLADDPLSDLEPEDAGIMRALLKEEHDSGTTVILATRNPKTIENINARIIRMEGGKIVNDRTRPAGRRRTSSVNGAARHFVTPQEA